MMKGEKGKEGKNVHEKFGICVFGFVFAVLTSFLSNFEKPGIMCRLTFDLFTCFISMLRFSN